MQYTIRQDVPVVSIKSHAPYSLPAQFKHVSHRWKGQVDESQSFKPFNRLPRYHPALDRVSSLPVLLDQLGPNPQLGPYNILRTLAHTWPNNRRWFTLILSLVSATSTLASVYSFLIEYYPSGRDPADIPKHAHFCQ